MQLHYPDRLLQQYFIRIFFYYRSKFQENFSHIGINAVNSDWKMINPEPLIRRTESNVDTHAESVQTYLKKLLKMEISPSNNNIYSM